MEGRQRTACPKLEDCIGSNGEHLSACVTGREAAEYVSKTPTVPAERLCLNGLANFAESRARNRLVDTYASISFDIDHLIATPNIIYDENDHVSKDNLPYKRELFNQIARQFEAIPNLDDADSKDLWTVMQLRRLALFMPAFKRRAFEEPLGSDLIGQIHENLIDYISWTGSILRERQLPMDIKKQVAAHMTECEAMAVLSRLREEKYFPWPALTREESSHARAKYNHDFYPLDSGRKYPIQVKTSANNKGYDDSIAVLRHYDILRAMKQQPEKHTTSWQPKQGSSDYEWPTPYVYEQILTGKNIDRLGALLIEERRQGRRFDRDKKQVLDLASSHVLAQIYQQH